MKRSSVQRLVHELEAVSYRLQVIQLRGPDRVQIVQRCACTLENITSEVYVNKLMPRFLGFGRPAEFVGHSLEPAKNTLLCAISGHGVIGPYFAEDEEE
ncbi:hypothetical protein PR048_005041 [Dryococelus australis]|uniref:Uncharacterized protein n=1 Tax=Dryococelus australis TaxID=614101 RepID=A0ABQ9I7Z1_9NEOP|nr:hypothetical protein PR048_005041 [Dryococelus australis]